LSSKNHLAIPDSLQFQSAPLALIREKEYLKSIATDKMAAKGFTNVFACNIRSREP